MDGAACSTSTSLLSKIKREERMIFYPVLFRFWKKIQAKKNSSWRKKPTSHTASTYEEFQDWKGDGNYVHYDHRSSSQGGADHRE
jgi:hypothetical protein